MKQKILLHVFIIISAIALTITQSRPGMHVTWPIYPLNTYRDKPEKELAQAIGTLSILLRAENHESRLPWKLSKYNSIP